MFGEDCKIVVDDFLYSTTTKMPSCNVTLYVKNVESCLDFFPIGVEQAVLETFKHLNLGDKLMMIISIKQLENGL
jgi:hypothetical protein